MRKLAAQVVLGLGLGTVACGPAYWVAPPAGLAASRAIERGIALSAYPSEWDGSPWDLDDYVTPIAVALANDSTRDVQVLYADFALTDAQGRRYPALHPFHSAPNLGQRDDTGVQLAQRGAPPHWGGHVGGGWHGHPGWHGGWHGWSGVHVAPGWGLGLGFALGFGLSYWGGPFWYPPAYWDSVYAWGPPYYNWRPSRDVLSLALPEGVLRPGGRVSGFLYFQRATGAGPRPLDLAWMPRDVQTHDIVGALHVPLVVVRR